MTLLQLRLDPSRISPAIKHAPDTDFIARDVIVDPERKSLGQKSMIAKETTMNAGIKAKRLNIGVERIEKIGSNPNLLSFIETEAVQQVGFRQAE